MEALVWALRAVRVRKYQITIRDLREFEKLSDAQRKTLSEQRRSDGHASTE